MNDALTRNKNLEKTAQKLLLAAWCIELVAASVGLFFAVSRLMQSGSMEEQNWVIGLQGALPFIAVAIVELTKIPLAYVAYKTVQLKWRLIFGISLGAAMFITFETFFMGFESYQAELTKKLKPQLDEITKLEREINARDEILQQASFELASNQQLDRQHKQRIIQIETEHANAVDAIEKQLQEINAKYSAQTSPLDTQLIQLAEQKAAIEKTIEKERELLEQTIQGSIIQLKETAKKHEEKSIPDLEAKIENLRQEQRVELTGVRKRYESKRKDAAFFMKSTIDEERDTELAKLNSEYDLRRTELEARKASYQKIVDTLSSEISRYEREKLDQFSQLDDNKRMKIQELDVKITSLTEKIAIAKQIEKSEPDADRIQKLQKDRVDADDRMKEQKLRETQNYNAKRQNLSKQEVRKRTTAEEIDELTLTYAAACSSLTSMVADNQIYRFAMQAFAENDACELDEKELSIIKAIWFGSLALIISGLGTMLSLAAFVVRDDKPRIEFREVEVPVVEEVEVIKEVEVEVKVVEKVEVIKEVPVNKIVEVIKEVPVDKVVFKEVPVEIVKKEIVHVPVYTNDVSLLGKNSGRNET